MMMEAAEVINIGRALAAANIPFWLDGGWGVDALTGRQTRAHNDLDLIVPSDRVLAVSLALAPLGYDLETNESPTRIVLTRAAAHQIDIHLLVLDDRGGGVQPLPDGSVWCCPPEWLSEFGVIAGQEVPCLSAEGQRSAHTGYALDDKDRHDLSLLQQHVGRRRDGDGDAEIAACDRGREVRGTSFIFARALGIRGHVQEAEERRGPTASGRYA